MSGLCEWKESDWIDAVIVIFPGVHVDLEQFIGVIPCHRVGISEITPCVIKQNLNRVHVIALLVGLLL